MSDTTRIYPDVPTGNKESSSVMTGDIKSTISRGRGRPKGSRKKIKAFPNASSSSKSYANVVAGSEANLINTSYADSNKDQKDTKGSKEKTKAFTNAYFSTKSYANVVAGREANVINTGYADSNAVSVGLINVRNDCFFNSTVQALFSLSSFVIMLRSLI